VRAAVVALTLAVSSTAFAQAEPAPEGYVPPSQRQIPGQPREGDSWKLDPDQPKWVISVAPRLVLVLGSTTPAVPSIGLGGGVAVHRAVLPLGRALRLGVGFDFAYDRVFHGDTNQEQLAHATFAGVIVLDALVGPADRLRPFLAVGGGLSVGDYEDANAPVGTPRSLTEALGLLHLKAGLAVRLYAGFEVGAHVEANLTFSTTTAGAPPVQVFQPGFLEVALDLGFRF
jgi:hypothetical protein